MKYSTKLSDAVHTMVLIAINPNSDLPSSQMAKSIKTNPSCIRQLMSSLRKAELITSITGHPKPALAKAPSDITLLEIYKAVEGEKPLLHLNTHTNPECGVGVNIQYALQDYYNIVQKAAEQSMAGITLANIIDNFQDRIKDINK